jgi:hypothetical protein
MAAQLPSESGGANRYTREHPSAAPRREEGGISNGQQSHNSRGEGKSSTDP